MSKIERLVHCVSELLGEDGFIQAVFRKRRDRGGNLSKCIGETPSFTGDSFAMSKRGFHDRHDRNGQIDRIRPRAAALMIESGQYTLGEPRIYSASGVFSGYISAMPYGISLKCLNETASHVSKLWEEAAAFEQTPSMKGLNYPAHITLAVLQDDPGGLDGLLADVFGSQGRLSIGFSGISYFRNEALVLWARPVPNDTLIRLHAALHRKIGPAKCHEYYRPDKWVPHCTLAVRVCETALEAAIKWADEKQLQFSVDFDAADFVKFPPVEILREVRLTAQ
jgi:2'-5' RNA ligase